MENKITTGSLTNKGIVHMIDNPSELIIDPMVKTTQGMFRLSELIKIEKATKPINPEIKETIDFKTVMSLDIRPGKVLKASRVKDTDKLIELTISTTLGKKTVVTNLGSHFEPEDFFINDKVGKTFMFVMNMSPMKMKGILSEAMIMASSAMKFDEESNSYKEVPTLLPVNISIDSIIL